MARGAPPFALAMLAALLSAGVWLAPRSARAEDIDGEVSFKSVGLRGNPLGVVIGRYSADLEYLPVPHHALHLSPVGYFALPGVSDELIGFGAELGYRYYSGAHGPEGFFVGGNFIALSLEYIHGTVEGIPLDAPDDTAFVRLGGAVDVGYQVIVLGNFAAGAGVGVEYTVDSQSPHFEYPTHTWHDLFFGAGLRPRVLLSLGAAF
jgi:hypothetical protein